MCRLSVSTLSQRISRQLSEGLHRRIPFQSKNPGRQRDKQTETNVDNAVCWDKRNITPESHRTADKPTEKNIYKRD